MSKRWENFKLEIATFLNRDPKWCWSRLVCWSMFHRWYSILLADERIYKLWITELFLWIRGWDYVDLQLAGDEGVDGYLATGCEYCLKCVYVRERKDCYDQSRARVQRRGDSILEARL